MAETILLEKVTKLCLKNAKQYVKDAELLYTFKSYGHALALTILSDIELGKAVVYHLWAKDLITEENLPSAYLSCFRRKQYGLFASKTWWIGLVIASNVEELVQSIIDISENIGNVSMISEFSPVVQKQINELSEKMNKENDKLMQFEDYKQKMFFVNFDSQVVISSPDTCERALAKDRIQTAKKRILLGEPFLYLSFNETSKIIAQTFLETAFQSILTIENKISEFVIKSPLR